MGKYRRLVIASVMGLYIQKSQGQQNFATIEKNVNIRAKYLIHDLNKTKDTLILKSTKGIDFVYSINSQYKRELDVEIGANSTLVKIPLNKLSKGKHTFIVGQSPLKIIFVVRVQKENPALALVTNNDKAKGTNKED